MFTLALSDAAHPLTHLHQESSELRASRRFALAGSGRHQAVGRMALQQRAASPMMQFASIQPHNTNRVICLANASGPSALAIGRVGSPACSNQSHRSRLSTLTNKIAPKGLFIPEHHSCKIACRAAAGIKATRGPGQLRRLTFACSISSSRRKS
jgi:hypothetical protein